MFKCKQIFHHGFKFRLMMVVFFSIVIGSIIFYKSLFKDSIIRTERMNIDSFKNNQWYPIWNEDIYLNMKESTDIDSITKNISSSNNILYHTPIDIALIFTKVESNHVLQYNLKRAVTSLLKNTMSPLRLHLITDKDSFLIGSKIINSIIDEARPNVQNIKLVFVTAEELAFKVEPIVKVLQEYFTNTKYSKYRDFLFFFSLFLHHLFPGLNNIILIDIDVVVNGDIADLYSHFFTFSVNHVIGLGPELSPVYRHILSLYRSKNPDTHFGSPLSAGGFPGYNSGVLLINIPRLKESTIINSYLTRKTLEEKTKEFSFRGHLGDQDLFTLIALDHPEVFHTLPCNWNRQLCKWWNIDLYENVFSNYFRCPGESMILHGNCKTEIMINDS